MSESQYDIVIFGATGFVGQIMVRYMAATYGNQGTVNWAIAGRSQSKLTAVQQMAKVASKDGTFPEQIIADAANLSQLLDMCRHTRVIVSTVGPFSLYGEHLIQACTQTGTDYCDITGEVHWVLQMASQYQQDAIKTGAKIVHCCGFDSIPSDLGVYFTHSESKKAFGKACNQIDMRVTHLQGTFSGGTFASLLNAVKDLRRKPSLRKALASPYCLCPSDHPFKTRQHTIDHVEYDETTQQWMAPFVMAGVNTRIVHRSNALFDNEYGEDFKYGEAVLTGPGPKGRKRASKLSFGLKALMIGAALAPSRWLLEKCILPKPGEGPSQDQQEKGAYSMLFVGKVQGKGTIRCTVTGDRDPGYGSTAKMLGEAAICLAQDIPKDQPGGGFWTPARIFKDKIITRLQDNAGVAFVCKQIDPE